MSDSPHIFAARLVGAAIFDPIGDSVGVVRDLVILIRAVGGYQVVGMVVEVPGRRRVFMPMTRVTSISAGQVITTGLINLRRFEQRTLEQLAMGDLLDRKVDLRDGSGQATIEDIGIHQRRGDWYMDQLFVRRIEPGHSRLSLRRRGSTMIVSADAVSGLSADAHTQGAALLLASYEGMHPADLADALGTLSTGRRAQVAAALDNERLADVMEELPEDSQVAILLGLPAARAADVLESMQPDDAADLLGALPEGKAEALLQLVEPDEASDIRQLLIYDEDTAGGLMTTLPVILGPETPVGMALAQIRRKDLTPALASLVFVTRPPQETPTGRFLGVVHFQRLLREPPATAIGTLLDKEASFVDATAPLGRVARVLAAYDALCLPVLDDQRRLLGVISVDDVLDHLLPEDWRESHSEGVEDWSTDTATSENDGAESTGGTP
ncbi:MAG: CBS domain-containing protein [Cellulomonadaceae bacterium]|nr:CBS domain-containing protein [Cellulomonadaceae bacterium]